MTHEVHYPGIDSRIRVFRHDSIVDTFVVRTDRFLIVVDTATRPDDMLRVMDAVEAARSDRLLLVVNTHGDWDHVWGNRVFNEPATPFFAPVLAHRLAVDRMKGPRAEELLSSMLASQPDRYADITWDLPTLLLDGPARIDGGDLSVELIPTPGHTPDHYALWLPELRYLLAGDAAELPFPAVSEDGSLSDLRDSLRRMASLDPSTALYCHAPGVTSPELLAENSRYFDELERRCRERGPDLLDAEHPAETLGWSADAIIARLAPDLDAEEVAFYHRFHDANIHAAARELWE